MSRPRAPLPSDEQARLLRRATAASVSVAVILIVAKSAAYATTGAVSLLASLVDSLMDAAASLTNLLAVRYALVPADREHRFGHGKAESLAALGQALLILGSSAYLIWQAGLRLAAPKPPEAVAAGIAVMLFSLVATGGLLLLLRHTILRTQSAAIKADALHYRADLLGNSAVLAALWLAQLGVTWADPVLAIVIALYLIVSTREIISQALNELLDRELPESQRQAILASARAHPQVHDVHDMRTRSAGRIPFIQLHIELDGDLSLREAHRVAHEVETEIRRQQPDADVVIHQDPRGIDEPQRWVHD